MAHLSYYPNVNSMMETRGIQEFALGADPLLSPPFPSPSPFITLLRFRPFPPVPFSLEVGSLLNQLGVW